MEDSQRCLLLFHPSVLYMSTAIRAIRALYCVWPVSPSHQCSSSISKLGCCGCSTTALPCLCTRRSPQRLPDKCTLIHNTCDGGLYIDSLIPPRPHCNMNSMLHQFKCVMSPRQTGSSTYHIYDMLQHIAGPGKNIRSWKKKKEWLWLGLCGFFIINEESNFQARLPIENYR